jgi:hypothetical protein
MTASCALKRTRLAATPRILSKATIDSGMADWATTTILESVTWSLTNSTTLD